MIFIQRLLSDSTPKFTIKKCDRKVIVVVPKIRSLEKIALLPIFLNGLIFINYDFFSEVIFSRTSIYIQF